MLRSWDFNQHSHQPIVASSELVDPQCLDVSIQVHSRKTILSRPTRLVGILSAFSHKSGETFETTDEYVHALWW